MKIVVLIARILLGLVFAVFGSNAFLNFIPMPPLPPGPAGQFLGALFASHYLVFIGGCQVVGGLLLLINRFVPLGLTILGPVIVNILLYHALMNRTGAGMAIVVAILWGIVAFRNRQYFSGLFVQKTA